MVKSIKRATIVNLDKTPSLLPSVSINNQPLEVQTAALNLIQDACKRIGMGIDDYLRAIKNGLEATITTTVLVDGKMVEKKEINHLITLKAAAMGLEVSGYLKAKGLEGVTNQYFDVKTLVQEFNKIK